MTETVSTATSMTSPRGYEAVKQLAKMRRQRIIDLLVLARQNDPFFAGAPTQRIRAEWFAELWRRFNYQSGIHLRRVHYTLVSQQNPVKQDGTPYENTDDCWSYLSEAGKAARYLRLVDPTAFEDRRNPDPIIFAPTSAGDAEPEWWVDDADWVLPTIRTDLALGLDFRLPRPLLTGYEYSAADQPYHLELWIEKSTMNDVLVPACRAVGMNLVTGAGFQSITSAIQLLRRVAARGKPARVFYVSDFDPAGDGMPVAVARQLEYWCAEYAPGADVKLTPLALTRAQVETYRLPRIPVKDTDRRKARFEERYGEGAVELDALEALYPGVLAQLVRDAAAPYRDLDLADRLQEAADDVQAALMTAWDDATAPLQAELTDLEAQARGIVGRYQAELERLQTAMQADLEPLAHRLADVRHAVQDVTDTLVVELPARPESDLVAPDESDWLFASERDYLSQLAVYRARKRGHGEEGAERDD